MLDLTALMDEFFATTSYNKTGDWREEPLTAEDPDDDQAKSLPIIDLEGH